MLFAHGERWRLDCGGFIRVNHNVTYAYDDGLRCRVSVIVNRRVMLLGGLVHRYVDNRDKGYVQEERPFGGVSILVSRMPVRTESTAELERFYYPSGLPPYNRCRSKVDLEKPARLLAPVVSTEVFFTAAGVMRIRAIAGVRHRMEGGGRWESGYQFQTDLMNGAWVPKHAVRTAFYFGDVFRRGN